MTFNEYRTLRNYIEQNNEQQKQQNYQKIIYPKPQRLIKQMKKSNHFYKSSQKNNKSYFSQHYLTNPKGYNKIDSLIKLNNKEQEYSNYFNNFNKSQQYVMSLQQYQNRKIHQDNQNKSRDQSPIRGSSYDSQNQKFKRNKIYDNQSFKQLPQDLNESKIQNNNQIFQMVFLNKKKNGEQYNKQNNVSSISTSASSFSKYQILNNRINKLQNNEQDNDQFSDKFINTMKIQDFVLGKNLGSGKFGQVFLARHRKTGFICAIKRINKNDIDSKIIIQLIRQIKIQSFLNHPNIVKLYTFFSDRKYIYFVLELCYSGQLYNFLKRKRKIQESLTKNIIQQSLKALDYMHENQIIHRDLKPQNIIFHNGLIKLCDFGWSISSKTMRQTFCGTPLYVSPQLLKRKNYNNKIDVWSIGILTYQLLFGRVPFDINTQRDFIKIVEDQIKFSKATKISEQAKDFILVCLKKDPRQRYTVPQLLQHPFFSIQQSLSMVEMY